MSHRLSAHAKIDERRVHSCHKNVFFFFSISWNLKIWIGFPISDFQFWIFHGSLAEVRGNERGTESSQIGNEKSVHIEFRC